MRSWRSAAWLGLGLCVAGCLGTGTPGLDEGPVLGSSTGDRPGITTFNSTVDPTLPGEESVEGLAEGTTTSAVDDTTSAPGTGTLGSTSEPGSTTEPSTSDSSSSTTDPTTGGGCNDVPGVYAYCLNGAGAFDTTPCMAPGDATCLYTGAMGSPTGAVCSIQQCTDACDCQAPATGNAVVSCSDVTGDPTNLLCSLDCSGGETCPDGMTCFGGGFCVWPGPGAEGTPYGDCFTMDDVCGLDGVCLNNGAMPTIGVCAEDCNVNADCPPSPGGAAPVTCEDLTGDGASECFLDCSGGQACPAGMTCFSNLLCAWD